MSAILGNIVRCLSVLMAMSLGLTPPLARADYPVKPIRLIAPFPPGNATDTVARTVARKLEEVLKQPVFVDNRPGAGGALGTELAAKAPADGYTLLVGSSGSLAINPGLNTKLSYKPLRDFAPIAQLATVPLFLAVNNESPARSAQDFVALAKKSPGSLNYGSNGNGTTTHLMMESFKRVQGIKISHVPYRGSGPALQDLMAGQIQVVFDTGTTLLPLAREGKLRILAIASKTRTSAAPDIQTVAESGLGTFDAPAWVGLVAPAGTPPDVIQTLNRALSQAWLAPDVRETLRNLGGDAVLTSPSEFSTYIADELEKWRIMIKDSGAQVD